MKLTISIAERKREVQMARKMSQNLHPFFADGPETSLTMACMSGIRIPNSNLLLDPPECRPSRRDIVYGKGRWQISGVGVRVRGERKQEGNWMAVRYDAYIIECAQK